MSPQVPVDLLLHMHSWLTLMNTEDARDATKAVSASRADTGNQGDDVTTIKTGRASFCSKGLPGKGHDGYRCSVDDGAARADVDGQIITLIRVGLLEKGTPEMVRFVGEHMVTVIYDMILHSRREGMHQVQQSTRNRLLCQIQMRNIAVLATVLMLLCVHGMCVEVYRQGELSGSCQAADNTLTSPSRILASLADYERSPTGAIELHPCHPCAYLPSDRRCYGSCSVRTFKNLSSCGNAIDIDLGEFL